MNSVNQADVGIQKISRRVDKAIRNGDVSVLSAAFANDNWRIRSIARSELGIDSLVLCALEGHIVGIRRLLHLGADPNVPASSGEHALHAGARAGYIEVVEEMLSSGLAQVNARSVHDQTALHAAAASRTSTLEIVNLLLNAGAKLDMRNTGCATPAHCAAFSGNVDVLRRLLDAGSDVNAWNNSDDCPFALAAICGQEAAMKCAMSYKPEILRDTENLSNVLNYATSKRVSVAICRTLIELGARIDYTEESSGRTCLHIAAMCGFRELLTLYLRQSSAARVICMTDSDDLTPLALACSYDRYHAAVLLMRYGAPLDGAGQRNSLLVCAVNAQSYRICRKLLLAGANPNQANDYEISPLELAANYGSMKFCRLLLSCNADQNFSVGGLNGPHPVLSAFRSGELEIAKYLIASGSNYPASCNAMFLLSNVVRYIWTQPPPANWRKILDFLLAMPQADINGHDDFGYTLLHEAQFPELARLLIDRGANVEARSKTGITPLIEATRRKRLGVCKVLLAAGAEVNARCRHEERCRTALLFAASNSDLQMVSLLLQHNASPDVADSLGKNALVYAIASGFSSNMVSKVITKLLQAGTKQVQGKLGEHAVHYAVGHGHISVLRALVEQGGSPEEEDLRGRTPLHMAAFFNRREMVKELCNYHAVNRNCVNKHGWTPLHVAARVLNIQSAFALIDHGANVNCVDHRGRTPLMVSCSAGLSSFVAEDEASFSSTLAIVNYLITKRANIVARTKRGLTAMHFAAMSGRPDVVLALLSNGARINTQTKNGRTPLHCAARSNRSSTVALLVSRGAAMDLRNRRGRSALYEAVARGSFECARLLISFGAQMKELPSRLQPSLSLMQPNLGDIECTSLSSSHETDLATQRSALSHLSNSARASNRIVGMREKKSRKVSRRKSLAEKKSTNSGFVSNSPRKQSRKARSTYEFDDLEFYLLSDEKGTQSCRRAMCRRPG